MARQLAESTEAGARQAARPQRADARRNVAALLDAAKTVFASAGVDAPAKEITDRAGVGVGTLYRHFPKRADLIVAVIQRDIDFCAAAGPRLSTEHSPGTALRLWLESFTELVGTKRGLVTALHSGDPAYDSLPAYFMRRLEPALQPLLEAAATAGEIRPGLEAADVLRAITLLCQPLREVPFSFNRRMVAIFIDGLREPSACRES
jgi:AcrR family transcriptional regulator